jgi:hypothetical protein
MLHVTSVVDPDLLDQYGTVKSWPPESGSVNSELQIRVRIRILTLFIKS